MSGAVEPAVLEAVGRALAQEAARFTAAGWMRGTSGNLSVVLSRDPLRLAVTVSGPDKGELRAGDVVVVDAEGRATEPGGPRPSAEAGLHARLAALTGAGAVVHVHAESPVLAAERWPDGVVLEDLEMLKGIGHPAHGHRVVIPVVPNSQDMAEIAGRFAPRYDGRTPALLLARHGMYAWGRDLVQARHHTEITEWLLRFAVARP